MSECQQFEILLLIMLGSTSNDRLELERNKEFEMIFRRYWLWYQVRKHHETAHGRATKERFVRWGWQESNPCRPWYQLTVKLIQNLNHNMTIHKCAQNADVSERKRILYRRTFKVLDEKSSGKFVIYRIKQCSRPSDHLLVMKIHTNVQIET